MLPGLSTVMAAIGMPQQGRLIVIRHGEADHNIQGGYPRGVFNSNPKNGGYFDSHLTDQGIKQVAVTAMALLDQGIASNKVHKVYVSPLPRTQETAEVLASTLGIASRRIQTDEAIAEPNCGEMDGLEITDERVAMIEDSWSKESSLWPGEKNWQLRDRVISFVKAIQPELVWGNVILVTHGSVLRMLGEQNPKVGSALILSSKELEEVATSQSHLQ